MNEKYNDHIITELINFYGHCNDINTAFNVFNSNENKSHSNICMGCMLTAYNNNEQFMETIELFEKSVCTQPNIQSHDTCLLQVLKAYMNVSDIEKAKEIALLIGKIINNNTIQLKTALIHFYGYIKDITTAINIYNSISDSKKDIFVIDVMMEVYCDNNMFIECLEVYKSLNEMNNSKVKPDLLTYINLFKACTHETAYYFGKMIHDTLRQEVYGKYILKHKEMQISLIHFYGKCGVIEKCEEIFEYIRKNEWDKLISEIAIWNAMIHAFGRNGIIENVKDLYNKMIEIGIVFDCQTYIVLLNAYTNCGDIESVQKIWNEDIMDEDIKYNEYIMTIVLDCMCKNGLLNETKQLIIRYHSECKVMWMSLLTACVKYNDIKVLKDVYNEIME